MRFILLVEGYTEKEVLKDFLERWFDYKYQQGELKQHIRFRTKRFDGWHSLVNDVAKESKLQLEDRKKNQEIISVISLLDLYGSNKDGFYPANKKSVNERYEWGKNHIEQKVRRQLKPSDHKRFVHFFAVHEIEAWLLSDPNIFPTNIQRALPNKIAEPEKVNFNEPPGKLLERLYPLKMRREYNKIADGKSLFKKLDPTLAYRKCPRFGEMLDTMFKLAKAAGL